MTAAITDEGAYVARLTESGSLCVPMFGSGSIEVGDLSMNMRAIPAAFWEGQPGGRRGIDQQLEIDCRAFKVGPKAATESAKASVK